MILLKKLIQEFLCERMTFSQLVAASAGKPDPSRMGRADHVNSKSVRVTTMDEQEAWTFSYKSQGHHSTTGDRHHGYVRFFKENVQATDQAANLDCMVDCSCPDYKYRWAYNNARAGAGITGNSSWNGNNGKAPRPREQGGVGQLGEGLCKHLISLGRFLQSQVEPEQPDKLTSKPEPTSPTAEPKPTSSAPVQKPKPEPTDQEEPDPTMMAAPQPTKSITPPKVAKAVKPTSLYSDPRAGDDDDEDDDTTYSDSRTGDITENQGSKLYQMMERFVRSHPQFDVPVYEDEKKPA
jgi:hypothetical protein